MPNRPPGTVIAIPSVPTEVVTQLFEMLEGTGGGRMLSLHTNDNNATYLYVCPAAPGLFGWTQEDLIGRSAYDFIHPDDQPPVESSHEYIRTVSHARAEAVYRLRDRDGEYAKVRTYSWVTEDGTIAVTDRLDGLRYDD